MFLNYPRDCRLFFMFSRSISSNRSLEGTITEKIDSSCSYQLSPSLLSWVTHARLDRLLFLPLTYLVHQSIGEFYRSKLIIEKTKATLLTFIDETISFATSSPFVSHLVLKEKRPHKDMGTRNLVIIILLPFVAFYDNGKKLMYSPNVSRTVRIRFCLPRPYCQSLSRTRSAIVFVHPPDWERRNLTWQLITISMYVHATLDFLFFLHW